MGCAALIVQRTPSGPRCARFFLAWQASHHALGAVDADFALVLPDGLRGDPQRDHGVFRDAREREPELRLPPSPRRHS